MSLSASKQKRKKRLNGLEHCHDDDASKQTGETPMGTNYYAVQEPCATCEHQPEPIHLAKTSAGWKPLLQVEKRGDDIEDWMSLVLADNVECIVDEYGMMLTPEELLAKLAAHAARAHNIREDQHTATLSNGWLATTEEFC